MVRLSKQSKGRNATETPRASEASPADVPVPYEMTHSQEEDYASIESYLTEKQIPELFNRLLTSVIHSKPDNLKPFILSQLEEIKKLAAQGQSGLYFSSEDFETIFDSYDIAQTGRLPYSVLVQALKAIGVEGPIEALQADFSELQLSSYISKPKFIQILTEEFRKRGYSF